MGKAAENKQQKLEALYENAYELFLNHGIEKTSISDIAKKAGVAKGTFYLYFTDKYDIRDQHLPKLPTNSFARLTKPWKMSIFRPLKTELYSLSIIFWTVCRKINQCFDLSPKI